MLTGLMFDLAPDAAWWLGVGGGITAICSLVEGTRSTTVCVLDHNSEANNENMKVHRL